MAVTTGRGRGLQSNREWIDAIALTRLTSKSARHRRREWEMYSSIANMAVWSGEEDGETCLAFQLFDEMERQKCPVSFIIDA
jgi:hypothetical protein